MLVSPVGNDIFGQLLRDEIKRLGMRTDGLVSSNQRSAICNMVLSDAGNLIGGVADMDITQSMESTVVSALC